MSERFLDKLQRYQHRLVFGSGTVITILILFGLAISLIFIAHDFILNEHQRYLLDKEQIVQKIEKHEIMLRNNVNAFELLWRQTAPLTLSLLLHYLRDDRQTIGQPYPTLIVDIPGSSDRQATVERYLHLTSQFSHIYAARSLNSSNPPEGGYHYSVNESVLALNCLSTTDRCKAPTPGERRALMEALRVPFKKNANGFSTRLSTQWLPPFIDPISREIRLRVAARAYDGIRPFAVLVSEYKPDMLISPLASHQRRGVFITTTDDNQLIAATSATEDQVRRADALLRMNVAGFPTAPAAITYRNGLIIFHDRLGHTRWWIAYGLSWREVAAGLALPVISLTGGAALLIALMWLVLLLFQRRMFTALFKHSQRIFEAQHLSHVVIKTVPIGLGLIVVGTAQFLLRNPALAKMAMAMKANNRILAGEVLRCYRKHVNHEAGAGSTSTMLEDVTLDVSDGRQIHLAISASCIRYQDQDVLVAAFADVTEERQAMAQLTAAARAAHAANASKSAFLAAMSHEIRAPLNVIQGNLKLLLRSPLNASQKDRLQIVCATSSGLLTLVNDILDFSKIEAGMLAIEHVTFDIVSLIERELAASSPMVRGKGLELFCQVNTAIAQPMCGDPTRLGQVLSTLLNHAIKFTQRGKITVRLSARLQPDEQASIILDIEDTGITIYPDQRGTLFDAFSQGDLSMVRHYGGTGLALALCQCLINVMGGTISIRSESQTSRYFSIRMPLDPSCPIAIEQPLFNGELIILITKEEEWQDFALPHLKAWGLNIASYQCPSFVPGDMLQQAQVLVIFGDHDAWNIAEENQVADHTISVVTCHPDGPIKPYRIGKRTSVSCYSLNGLASAIGQVLDTKPQPHTNGPGPTTLTDASKDDGVSLANHRMTQIEHET